MVGLKMGGLNVLGTRPNMSADDPSTATFLKPPTISAHRHPSFRTLCPDDGVGQKAGERKGRDGTHAERDS